METFISLMQSPIGTISIHANAQAATSIHFREENDAPEKENPNAITIKVKQQLQEYFDGKLRVFDFPMAQEGTEFQQLVWETLYTIPFGETKSYLQQSKQMNMPLAIRAMAAANGKNNLSIVVPCHRIIGSSGKLVGYAGGLWRKQWLLEHEHNIMGKGQLNIIF